MQSSQQSETLEKLFKELESRKEVSLSECEIPKKAYENLQINSIWQKSEIDFAQLFQRDKNAIERIAGELEINDRETYEGRVEYKNS